MISSALLISLQHPVLADDLSSVCKLLCVSKSLAAAVNHSLQGTLTVRLAKSTSRTKGFVPWLQKNAILLQKVTISVADSAIETAMGSALQQASRSAGGLPLQSLTYCSVYNAASLITDLLPGRHLTHLHLATVGPLGASILAVAQALASLTGLKSLYMSDNRFQSSLEELLEVVQPLCLGHLTSCTHLELGSHFLTAEDVLPTNLRHLQISGCLSASPLLGLVHLQELGFDFMPTTEVELVAQALTGLKCVHVNMLDQKLLMSAAEHESTLRALSPLPVKNLNFGRDYQLSAMTLHYIGQFSTLTALNLRVHWPPMVASNDLAGPFATALSHLRALRSLQVVNFCSNNLHAEDATQTKVLMFGESSLGDCCSLMQAIGSLPNLEHLFWSGFNIPPLALVHLSSCKNLRWLEWWDDVDDFALTTWAWGLTNLEDLNIGYACARATSVTNAALPTIAKVLTKLTRLALWGCAITDVGVDFLSSLRSLQSLRIHYCDVSPNVVERVLRSCAGSDMP